MATHSSILAWKSHGQRSLVGYSSKGHKESDTTEATYTALRGKPCLFLELQYFPVMGGDQKQQIKASQPPAKWRYP